MEEPNPKADKKPRPLRSYRGKTIRRTGRRAITPLRYHSGKKRAKTRSKIDGGLQLSERTVPHDDEERPNEGAPEHREDREGQGLQDSGREDQRQDTAQQEATEEGGDRVYPPVPVHSRSVQRLPEMPLNQQKESAEDTPTHREPLEEGVVRERC